VVDVDPALGFAMDAGETIQAFANYSTAQRAQQ
jgi:hypothetical protein